MIDRTVSDGRDLYLYGNLEPIAPEAMTHVSLYEDSVMIGSTEVAVDDIDRLTVKPLPNGLFEITLSILTDNISGLRSVGEDFVQFDRDEILGMVSRIWPSTELDGPAA